MKWGDRAHADGLPTQILESGDLGTPRLYSFGERSKMFLPRKLFSPQGGEIVGIILHGSPLGKKPYSIKCSLANIAKILQEGPGNRGQGVL